MTHREKQIAIEVSELTRIFGSFHAVSRVNFVVYTGEIFGFLGPNGAGKSTTIRMLCGLLSPTSGSARVVGYDISKDPEAIKANIGYMSQRFSLYDDLTVEENINFYGGIYGLASDELEEKKRWVLKMAQIETHRKKLTAPLSGGWKQRLALGCAILHEPKILFLDEPTSGVDPISRRNFWQLIYKLSERGMTVFVTTHYMEEAEYCDRLGMMYQSKLIATGSPSELKNRWMQEKILELSCNAPQDVMLDLEKLEYVSDVSLFGPGLHLVVNDVNKAKAEVVNAFAGMQLELKNLRQIPPSMEDVFVSLVEAQLEQPTLQAGVQ
ncbi:ATP-binding cassette domain-containing protein [Candidatus Riflebacteria bacterium]